MNISFLMSQNFSLISQNRQGKFRDIMKIILFRAFRVHFGIFWITREISKVSLVMIFILHGHFFTENQESEYSRNSAYAYQKFRNFTFPFSEPDSEVSSINPVPT